MWTVIFLITTLICAFGWFTTYVAAGAMLYYMATNGYKLPDKAERKECFEYIAKKILKFH